MLSEGLSFWSFLYCILFRHFNVLVVQLTIELYGFELTCGFFFFFNKLIQEYYTIHYWLNLQVQGPDCKFIAGFSTAWRLMPLTPVWLASTVSVCFLFFVFFSFTVDILLKAVGDTPIMKTKKWAVERTRTIQGLIDFIKKFLKLVASEQLVRNQWWSFPYKN